jgi:hypothetical protein
MLQPQQSHYTIHYTIQQFTTPNNECQARAAHHAACHAAAGQHVPPDNCSRLGVIRKRWQSHAAAATWQPNAND